ncbi:MAG: ribonuclease HI family protein [Anaerolineae bacterium]|nr:ribonuclease HI family protein [Anaerolineae bacterium]
MYTLRFDGLFRSANGDDSTQAGFMCYGWLIFHNKIVIARGHGGFAHACFASSNGAEYLALIEGLEAMLDLGIQKERIRVVGDAKSVIQQMQGLAAVRSAGVVGLHQRAMRLSVRFSRLKWLWIPRSENKDADQLTRRALRCIRADREHYQAAMLAMTPGKRPPSRYMPLVDLRIYTPRAVI